MKNKYWYAGVVIVPVFCIDLFPCPLCSLPEALWSKVCIGRPGTTMIPCLPLNKATFTMRTNCWDSPVSVNSKSVPTPVWSTRTSKMSSVNATTLTLPILRTRLHRPMLITTLRMYKFRSYMITGAVLGDFCLNFHFYCIISISVIQIYIQYQLNKSYTPVR